MRNEYVYCIVVVEEMGMQVEVEVEIELGFSSLFPLSSLLSPLSFLHLPLLPCFNTYLL